MRRAAWHRRSAIHEPEDAGAGLGSEMRTGARSRARRSRQAAGSRTATGGARTSGAGRAHANAGWSGAGRGGPGCARGVTSRAWRTWPRFAWPGHRLVFEVNVVVSGGSSRSPRGMRSPRRCGTRSSTTCRTRPARPSMSIPGPSRGNDTTGSPPMLTTGSARTPTPDGRGESGGPPARGRRTPDRMLDLRPPSSRVLMAVPHRPRGRPTCHPDGLAHRLRRDPGPEIGRVMYGGRRGMRPSGGELP